MNRPLFVDPQYVNKLREGRIDEIAPCTRCMHCFYDADLFSKNIVREQAVLDEYGKLTITGMEYDPEAMKDSVLEHCRVNASSWRAYGGRMPEGFNPLPANGSKNVMVVGAGPAGMEAARIAAQRGYDVTLYEKKRSVGGLLSFAHAVKGPHENLKRLRIYLQRQQEIMGVTVVTNKEVDADFIKAQNPDVVILAVGGKRGTSGLSGTSGTRIISIDDALRANIGDNVTIIGSNCQAVDVAVYLLSRGKHVTIVTPDPMSDFDKGHSVNVMEKVKALILAKGTRVWPDSSITAVGNGEITIHNETGVDIADVVIKCDAIIEAMDALPNTDLLNGLSGIETHAIGDCSTPYNISEAISSGNLTARKI
jgi:NADPH-dependent 2,4-dienoyl-CoA reductase/sulfur reductase-like enzyme